MKDEIIIRQEAKEFFESINDNTQTFEAIDDFHKIKKRLSDFYNTETKSLFLDEVQTLIKNDLKEHRDKKHEGKPGVNCPQERKPEKLLFYIRQEIGTLPVIAHQTFKTNPQQTRNKVFISYSHLDKQYLNDIQRHFKPFLKKIDFWDDTKIQAGQKWKEEIRTAINEAKVAILLVSTDFLGSEFIATEELPPLLKAAEKNGAVILILIVKPCLFEEFKELNQYQAMNQPTRPLIKMDDTEKEELLVNLVRQTIRILDDNKK